MERKYCLLIGISIFAVCDFWSGTGFNATGQQPTPDLPWGNPLKADGSGTGGPNWVHYITNTYNDSLVLTYNYAAGGAYIDPEGRTGEHQKLQQQILVDFTQTQWTADTSLFLIWAGVNDVIETSDEREFEEKFKELRKLLDHLHNIGARNFLLFNTAPLDRSPRGYAEANKSWIHQIQPWNENITHVAKLDKDASMFLFDTHKLFGNVMDDPSILEESAGFKNVTGFCPSCE
ncbi:hypothetical protein AMS68_002274 [Peltaster fructicola]|uniref:SGNH hydrolase-type esterase domain-containing protein n=1 Tax=Peltaster fructicola TaxID=286661 RepID=A0A6H0XPR9_9PEZI|nr:hypothetical protein AMS68_002274 [Peltaster fructicola]